MDDPQSETAWSVVKAPDWNSNLGAVLLWREDWVNEDFNPTGIREGYFQDGDPGEEHFNVAAFNADQDCYYSEEITDPAEWPTHWRHMPAPPPSMA